MSDDDKTQPIATSTSPDATPQDATPQDDVSTPAPPTRALPTPTEDYMDTDRVTEPVTIPSTGATPAPSPATPEPAVWTAATVEPRGVRVGTVVWGLVIAAVGVGLLAFASGVVFDVELALIGLVAAAGVALLAGSLANGRRRRGR